MPDFKRAGSTTYRFRPDIAEYEVREPGGQPSFIHDDPDPGFSASDDGTYRMAPAGTPGSWLPADEMQPECRTSGHRVVAVHTYPKNPDPELWPHGTTYYPGYGPENVREVIRQITWKINDQALKSTNGAAGRKLAVDCDGEGHINVYELATDGDGVPAYWNAVTQDGAVLPEGNPKGSEAVKYLTFINYSSELGCVGTWNREPLPKSTNNPSVIQTDKAVAGYGPGGACAIHELFHNLGAVKEKAPYYSAVGNGGHCSDGLDIMCYGIGTACKSTEGYGTPTNYPLDCHYDTYFNAWPEPGNWLLTHYDTAGPENPFLVPVSTENEPSLSLDPASNLEPHRAELNGSIDRHGFSTTYHFDYIDEDGFEENGFADAESTPEVWLSAGEGSVDVEALLTKLKPGTPYHARLVAENASGASESSEVTFTTKELDQIVTVMQASEVFSTSAMLNGTVDTKGNQAVYLFEYGQTTEYGEDNEEVFGELPAGQGVVDVHNSIEGLKLDTLYHFRVAALIFDGEEYVVAYSPDETFRTRRRPSAIYSDSYPVSVSGEQLTQNILQPAPGYVSAKCQSALFDGEAGASTSTLPLEAAYSGCTAFGTLPTTIAMNSCTYTLHAANAGPPYTGDFGVACSESGDAIKVTVYKEDGTTTKCRISIPAQKGHGNVTLTNVGEGSQRGVEVGLSVTGIENTTEDSLLNCGVSKGLHTNGTYSGSIELFGENAANEDVGVYLGGDLTTGMYLAGKESTEESAQPRFNAETYPAAIVGEQLTQNILQPAPGYVSAKCQSALFDGEAGASTSTLPLEAAYSGCTAFGTLPTTIAMNSCTYTLHAANAGPPYTGDFGVACSESGDAIKVTVYKQDGTTTKCRINIPAQEGHGNVTLTNVGEGSQRGVEVGLSVTGIENTTEDSLLNCGVSKGLHTNGTYSGSLRLYGFP